MPGNFTAREVATRARQWGFYVDEGRGGPGHVGLVWKGRLIATMRHPLRPAKGFTSPVTIKKLATTVGVHDIDTFMAGPIKAKPSPLEEPEPAPPQRKEQPAMAPKSAGYVPPSTRPRLQQEIRGLTRIVEQVLCVADKPMTAVELYPEVVKHVPYATVDNVHQVLQNAAYVNRIRKEGRQPNKNSKPTSIWRVESGRGSRQVGTGATFQIEPPQFFPADEIEDLPNWRPREYTPRGKAKKRAPVKRSRKPIRTVTGKVLTDADIQRLADEAERGYDVKPEPEPTVVSSNGTSPPVFEAVARRFDDPDVLIIRDDQGGWWEARRVPGLLPGS